ncbi:MAG: SUMF1/EgtB/PvdO family nonheme iron enzyme [Ignavibacteriales bacterium]|nr:MAG: SUMF1/EgtB/PvdO family nonheme iron enzyme [Ignavibacteriaceae bacterium]MBW7873670.1 SUMF1/EgtB/PvdO family nonheme iron enzyme [Ignavibacteria bacterium]MCZ2143895.1 SUMF1/EgtB/PvdO family nonheme iron enzyme [Ignavibacteriales bacterium]OQY70839.1 MAG: hypothetical protein B6D45_10800 [Ignavibacteriales bacterium UTCHB3]MBV6444574.1 Hercynine oxygenase [Ignavibacteriaceae bacterium]
MKSQLFKLFALLIILITPIFYAKNYANSDKLYKEKLTAKKENNTSLKSDQLINHLSDLQTNTTCENPKQGTGKLQFTVNPDEAECTLSQNGAEKYRWTGLKIFNAIPAGIYDLKATCKGRKPHTKKITIKENQTTITEIEMVYGVEMVFVKGGTFTMGFTSEQVGVCYDREKPAHQVTLSDFYIAKYEVTEGLWNKVMNAQLNSEEPLYPAEPSDWEEIIKFCNKLSALEGLQRAYSFKGKKVVCNFNANGYRLPTEAEWEYAARGGNKSRYYRYSGSDNINEVAWYLENSDRVPHEIGTKKPNELGIYDMSGNACELCWDWYGNYTASKQINPRGPATGEYHVIRGGGYFFLSYDQQCLVMSRGDDQRTFLSGPPIYGFRLVRTK